MGIGDDHYPLPWQSLKYDTALGGYVVDLDRRRLENAPRYSAADQVDWGTYGGQVDNYYLTPVA